MLEMENNRLE